MDVSDAVDKSTEAVNTKDELLLMGEKLNKKCDVIKEDTVCLRYDYDLLLHTNTRQVNWRISHFRDKLYELMTTPTSLWSPAFTIATFPATYLQVRLNGDN